MSNMVSTSISTLRNIILFRRVDIEVDTMFDIIPCLTRLPQFLKVVDFIIIIIFVNDHNYRTTWVSWLWHRNSNHSSYKLENWRYELTSVASSVLRYIITKQLTDLCNVLKKHRPQGLTSWSATLISISAHCSFCISVLINQ